MSGKNSVFTMKLESELHEEFMAEARACHRPAAQIVREFMRDFVRSQRDTRRYDALLHDKVEAARQEIREGRFNLSREVEARFADRRARLLAGLEEEEEEEVPDP